MPGTHAAAGCGVGVAVGAKVGVPVGAGVGAWVGALVGACVGVWVGALVGVVVGAAVGALVGLIVAHTRSVHSVGATPSNHGEVQAVAFAHSRSLVALHAAAMYWPAAHAAVVALHTRSAVAVPAADSYSLARVAAQPPPKAVATGVESHSVCSAQVGGVAADPYVTAGALV